MQVGHRLLVRAPVWQVTSFSDAFLRFENAVSLHLHSVSVPYPPPSQAWGYGTETEGRWTKSGGSEPQVCLFDHLAALVFRINENQQRRTGVSHDSPGHPASVWLMELRLLGQPECVGLLPGKSLRSGSNDSRRQTFTHSRPNWSHPEQDARLPHDAATRHRLQHPKPLQHGFVIQLL